MAKEYYVNDGIPPAMQSWNSFSLPQELNCNTELTSACLLNPTWDKQTDHLTQFHSALSSGVSSPVVPTSSAGIRELIAKLGPIWNPGGNPPPFSSGFGLAPADTSVPALGFNPKPQGFPLLSELNLPNLANSVAMNSPLPAFSDDPEFAERAAKFSWFGSRSFTTRTSDSALSDAELPHRSSAMTRVWSSPSLKHGGSPIENKKLNELPPIAPNSNECSSISEQVPSGETVSRVPNEINNSRKRKAAPKAKAKQAVSAEAVDSEKFAEGDDVKNGKRSKTRESSPSEKGAVNKEWEEAAAAKDGGNTALGEQHKQDMVTQKPPEPPKDYIHVRARRGQATDSHSLAERVRREKIGERMKLLQDLVPGCNKVTGKALMLDEIINYVQSLQRQVEFLSMKLAAVDPRQEVNVDNFTSKDISQPNGTLLHCVYPANPSVQVFYGHQPKQCPPVNINASLNQCPMDPVHNPLNAFVDAVPLFPASCEDDLHSIVRMGFSQDAKKEESFSVADQLRTSP